MCCVSVGGGCMLWHAMWIRDNIAELILSYLWVPGLKLRSSALVTDILAR